MIQEESGSGAIEGTVSDNETEEKFIDATNNISTIVYIHGSCVSNGNSSKAGIGVYWGPENSLNVSEPIKFGKKTSNTADLLAAIRVLEQASEKKNPVMR